MGERKTEAVPGVRERAAILTVSTNAPFLGGTPAGTVLACSAGAEWFLGRNAGNAVGSAVYDLFPVARQEELRHALEEAQHGRDTQIHDLDVTGPGGQRVRASVIVTPIRTSSGQTAAATMVATTGEDAHPRQEEALVRLGLSAISHTEVGPLFEEACEVLCSELHAEYARVLELLPDGSGLRLRASTGWLDAPRGEVVEDASPRSESGFVLRAGDPVVVTDLRSEQRFAPSASVLKQGAVSGLGIVIPGRERPFGVISVHSRHMRAFTSEQTGFVEAVGNVLGAAVERRAMEERFQGLLEAAPDAIIAADERGRIVLANRQTETLFGYTREEILERSVEALIPARYRSLHVMHRAQYSQAPRPRPMGEGLELYGLHKDGTEFPVEISLSPFERAGRLVVLAAIRDATDRKRIEAALSERAADLERSNADLERFAHVASHDLQEPLRVMKGYLELLHENTSPHLDATGRECVHAALGAAARMEKLIHDLLAYARVGTRGKAFDRVPADRALRAALANLEAFAREKEARVTVAPLPTVVADEVQLTQLFQNLIANAMRFRGPQPPHVRVSAERDDGGWRFSIEDNGIGIPPENLGNIFEVFYRVHGEDYPGTGIGLAICRRIVERHGGRIWVESQVGRGSTFFFTIPGGPA